MELQFKSLVVLDLETTGLPCHGKPKITELCLIGVLRDHLIESQRTGRALPRVLHKLCLCFYPKKMIHFEASDITGLDNMLLEDIAPWNEKTCDLLTSFLNRLPMPVCIVAHNGINFDFQLLKSEMAAFCQMLPDNLIWADTLPAFRALIPDKKCAKMDAIVPLGAVYSNLTLDISHSQAPTLSDVETVLHPDRTENGDSDNHLHDGSDLRKKNETTPKQVKQISNPPPVMRKLCEASCSGNRVKARKKLFPPGRILQSHKLIDIYHYLYGKDPSVSHCAESDALALLECIGSTSPEILDWIDRNNTEFSSIPPMW